MVEKNMDQYTGKEFPVSSRKRRLSGLKFKDRSLNVIGKTGNDEVSFY